MQKVLTLIISSDDSNHGVSASLDLTLIESQQGMEKYIRKFSEIGIDGLALVGGKNASLGEMFRHLKPKGILMP